MGAHHKDRSERSNDLASGKRRKLYSQRLHCPEIVEASTALKLTGFIRGPWRYF
jgi:hypothetical protein